MLKFKLMLSHNNCLKLKQHILIVNQQLLQMKMKLKAMWIGSSRNNTEKPLALKWRKTLKALGFTLAIVTKNQCKRIFTISSKESNLRYACGVGEASPCLVKSQLLRVYYSLKFYTFRQFVPLLWSS